jgi:VWFA-related protein
MKNFYCMVLLCLFVLAGVISAQDQQNVRSKKEDSSNPSNLVIMQTADFRMYQKMSPVRSPFSNPPAVHSFSDTLNPLHDPILEIQFQDDPYNHNMHIASDGNFFYTVNGGNSAYGKINKYSLAGTFVASYSINLDMRSIMYNRADGFFYVSTYERNFYKITDIPTGSFQLIYTALFDYEQASPALSWDGNYIFSFYAGTLKKYNFSNGTLLQTLTGLQSGTGNYGGDGAVAVDPDYIYTWDASTRTVYVYDMLGNLVRTMVLSNGNNGISLSFINGYLFVSDDGNYSIGTWYGFNIRYSGGTSTSPLISVSPSSFDVSLQQGDSTSQTLTISNTGLAPLDWEINNFPFISLARIKTIEPAQSYSNKSWSTSREYASGKNMSTRSSVSTIPSKSRNTSSTGGKILFLSAGGTGNWSNIKSILVSTGMYSWSDFDTLESPSTLTAADLQYYSAVLVWTNSNFPDPTMIGDVLKQYVDAGGGVVLATYAFSTGWAMQGGILNANYSPFIPASTQNVSGTLDMTSITQPGHPIFQGIVNAPQYWNNSNYSNPTLNTGGVLLAKDTQGNNLIAENPTGKVVAVCIYPGYLNESNTETHLLFANALRYVGGIGGRWLGLWPQSGTVAAGSSQDVIVKFRSNTLNPGTYNDVISITSNDQIHNPLEVPVTMNVTGRMSLLNLIYNQIDPVSFPTIQSYVTVSDQYGNPISSLTEVNFEIQEDDVSEIPIIVTPVDTSSSRISVALVIDRSGSMSGQSIENAQSAASIFVRQLRGQDQAAIVSFSTDVTVDQNFTTDTTALIAAINNLVATGNTAVYDGVNSAVTITSQQLGRKAIILLSDGGDNSSTISSDTVIYYAQHMNVPVYTIGLGMIPGSFEENVLKQLALQTGGEYFPAPNSSDLIHIYQAISRRMQNQYIVTYTTHNKLFNGTLRTVSIKVAYNHLTDAKIKTYVAPMTAIGAPAITNIYDVPNDAGKFVFVTWSASPNDGKGTSIVTKYSVWRKDKAWTFIGDVTSRADSSYSFIAPTLHDSGELGVNYSLFQVAAHTADPTVFANSPVDSGYSINNKMIVALAPPRIVSIKDVPLDNGKQVYLAWRASADDRKDHGLVTKYTVWRKDQSWVFLTELAAKADSIYTMMAPTMKDSGTVPAYFSHFRVVAHSPDPGIFAESAADSGYSVNNLKLTSVPTPVKLWVKDVPNDNGHQVFVAWKVSKPAALSGIASFSVWRKDSLWTQVTESKVTNDTMYSSVASTIYDSTKISGQYWTTFRVVSHSSNPEIFAVSDTMRGYSVDNIYPQAPGGLEGITNGNDMITLKWKQVADEDLKYYQIYRSESANFDISGITFVANVADTFYVDRNLTANKKYHYKIIAVDYSGNESKPSSEFSLTVSAVPEGLEIPTVFTLNQNYPNPFNPSTTIRYAVPTSSRVKITIYTVLGEAVEMLANRTIEPGFYEVVWNASCASGIYFYRIEATPIEPNAKPFIDVKRMLLLK